MQAFEAETPKLRDHLLELARLWTKAALCEKINSRCDQAVRDFPADDGVEARARISHLRRLELLATVIRG